ncbi:hypothetical protein Tco_0995065 [Tanacetum coccineum]
MAVLPNIPCPKDCRIVRKLLIDHAISYALTATADVPAVILGYQGSLNKVSAFFTKNLAQPWQTMFKKFKSIPKRLKEDYHKIKDDTLLVNVYTTREVTVRGMLILNDFLTTSIKDTQSYKDYEVEY